MGWAGGEVTVAQSCPEFALDWEDAHPRLRTCESAAGRLLPPSFPRGPAASAQPLPPGRLSPAPGVDTARGPLEPAGGGGPGALGVLGPRPAAARSAELLPRPPLTRLSP